MKNGTEDSPLGSHVLNRRSVTALETKEDEARHNARASDSVEPSNPNDKPSPDPRTDSSFVPSPVDRYEDQHSAINSREQEADTEVNSFKPYHGLSGERNAKDRSDSYRSQSDEQLPMLDLIRNRRFENLGFGLPGQPVRKLVDFVMNRLALKPTSSNVNQQTDSRSPRNLLEHARSLLRDVKGNIESGVSGMHKAVGLGNLSENSNTGRS
ncbi:uncharacterized protein LOC128877254 [Hylaeus volcanicus]|uniref:uncharacterized protein LOC128877254 n=1 Tax=Hylaeus volcanicus TaxID=313075 RepID=UPI0023B86B9D|nr:uncharacterized protein LOC128877254 [Hylaeus volcanicus]